MSRLVIDSDVWKSSWRELGLVVSVLKLADGWLSSSLVLPCLVVDSTAELLGLQSCCHMHLHGHPLETESAVLFFYFAVSLLFLFSSDIQTCVLMEPHTFSAIEIGTLPRYALP